MKNRSRLIVKALASGKNTPRAIFFVWILSALVIFSFLHLMNVMDLLTIATQKDMYGKYSIKIPYSEEISAIHEDTRVKGSLCTYDETIMEDESYLLMHYAEEEFLTFSNLSIVEGEYPESENEIAVERRYMYRIGIPNEEMLGSVITVGEKTYTVSAIVVKNTCFDSGFDSSEYKFLLAPNSEQPNACYLELFDLKNYKRDMDSICEQYGIDNRKCYVNIELFASLGYISEDVQGSEQTLMYVFFAIVMVVVLHTLNNYVKIWMNRIADDIANLGVLGVSFRLMAMSLFVYLTIGVIISLLVGGIGAFLICILVWKANSKMITFEEVIECIPIDILYNITILYCIISMIQMLWLLLPLIRCNANKLKREGNILLVGRKFKFKKHYFSSKKPTFIYSMFKKNTADNRVGRFVAICGIAIAVTLFAVGLYFGELDLKQQGHKNDMDYKVIFAQLLSNDKEERKQQARIYEQIKEMEECTIFPEYSSGNNITLTREELGDEYLKFLWEVVDSSAFKFYKTGNEFVVNVMIIGYDDEQLRELYNINSMEYEKLATDEVLVLDTTVSIQGTKGFDVNIGNTLQIDDKIYNVKNRIDELITYEEKFTNKICIVVNESTYYNIFNQSVPDSVYIKVASEEAKKEVEQKLIGNDLLQLEQPKESYQSYENGVKLLNNIVIAIVFVMMLPVVVSIFSNMILRFYINKTEYQLLNIIGVSKNVNAMVFLLEMVHMMFIGIVLSIPITYVLTKKMMISAFGKTGLYYYSFPIMYYGYVIAVLVLSVCIISFFMRRKIKEVGILRA